MKFNLLKLAKEIAGEEIDLDFLKIFLKNKKLTDEQVHLVRAAKGTAIEINKKFNIDSSTVIGIKSFKIYKKVLIKEKIIPLVRLKKKKLTNSLVHIIRYADGCGAEIGKKFNVHPSTVKSIKSFETYKKVPIKRKIAPLKPICRKRLTDNQVHLIRIAKENSKEISEKFDTQPSTVINIKLLKAYIGVPVKEKIVPLHGINTVSNDIHLIRSAEGTSSEISKKFNIDRSTVRKIKNFKSYKDVPIKGKIVPLKYVKRIADSRVHLIRSAKGTATEIGKRFGIDRATVRRIKSFKLYKQVPIKGKIVPLT